MGITLNPVKDGLFLAFWVMAGVVIKLYYNPINYEIPEYTIT